MIEIALDCGFDSQEAFTRAFRRWYGVPPARFRRRALPYMLKDTPPLSREGLESLIAGELSLQPRFESRGGSLFIGIPSENTARRNRIPQAWMAFLRRMGEIQGAADLSTYGIYRYDFAALREVIGEEFPFGYLAALELSARWGAAPPRGMEAWELGPARYAVFAHRGRLRDLVRAYRYIYKTWFPHQARGFAAVPFFERRAPDFPGDRDDAETEIWIPLEE